MSQRDSIAKHWKNKIECKDAQKPWIHSPVAALKAKAFLDGYSDKWNVKAAGLVVSSQL